MKNQLKQHFKIASKNTLPICDYLKISETEIVADNLDIRISTKNLIPTIGEGLILASDFKKIVDKKTIDKIVFNDNEKVTLFCGKSEFTFTTENLEEFIKEKEGFENKGTITFDESFKVAQNFIGKDEFRPAMSGVYFDKDYIVSTDAHVLYYKKHNQQLDVEGMIFPKDSFFLDGEFSFRLKENYIQLTNSDMKVTVRLVDEKYPNYMAVIPTDNPNKILFSKKELDSLLNDALICTNKQTKKIVLSEQGISSEDIDFGKEYKASFTSRKVLSGEIITQSFNADKLLKILKFVDSDVIIENSTSDRGVLINENFLLMPVIL